MDRLILNQECIHHEPGSLHSFSPKEKDSLKIKTVDLGEFNGSFAKGKHVEKKVLENCINHIITDVDSILTTREVEYSGKSLTPFIFLAAQRFKLKNIQLSEIGLWHNFRNLGLGIGTTGWRLLNDNESIPIPTLEGRWVNPLSSHNDEMTITFSTSFPIDRKDLIGLNPLTFKHYHFSSKPINDVDVDTVFCRKQAEMYANEVHKLLAVNPSCKKVHLAISSSVSMTFCLAYKLLNENYSKEISVYHYDSSQNPCRPWGITFSNNDKCEAIIN